MFSKSATSPSFNATSSLSAPWPTKDFTNKTSLPKTFDKYLATGSKLNSFLTSPFGLPKWAIKITFAPLSVKYWTVGTIACILVSSVTLLFSSKGTFISTLTNARFPLISLKSLIDFFIL